MNENDPSTIISTAGTHATGDVRACVPAITIEWCHDVRRIGATALLSGKRCEVSRHTPPFESALDVHVPRSAFLGIDMEEGGVHLRPLGTTPVDVAGSPLQSTLRLSNQQLDHGVMITVANAALICLHRLHTPVLRGPAYDLIGVTDAVERLRRDITKIAQQNVPVLLRGETGTGKEMVAVAIATASGRKPFIAQNIARIPPTVAAEELFGHERGAYTGATEARPGYFVEADGGTLFLDEIGEIPLEVGKALLRVLEEWVVWPLGARRPKKVDVRVITATDRNLEAAIAAGEFSGPLFHRLGGYQIHLPPLRERRADIGPLFLHFVRQHLEKAGEGDRLLPRAPTEQPWLSPRHAALLGTAVWTGNIRALNNVASQLVYGSQGRHTADFEVVRRSLASDQAATSQGLSTPSPRTRASDEDIQKALRAANYNYSAAAKALGINRTTLYERTRSLAELRNAAEISDAEVLDAHARLGGDVQAMAAELRCSPKPLKKRLTDVLRRTGRE